MGHLGRDHERSTAPEVYVARQPIFDRRQKVVGYELLFRDAYANTADEVGRDAATASVVLDSLTEIGLKKLVGARSAWINVSRQFLLEGLDEVLPARAVVELDGAEALDDQMIAAIGALKRRGVQVALDDWRFADGAELLLELVDTVKLDLIDLGRDQFRSEVASASDYDVQIVGKRIENQRDHAFCERTGCDLFQGYFFCRPEIMHGARIEANKLAVLDLLTALHDPDTNLEDLQRKIAVDVGLSVRLLRYINSAYFGLRQPVRSIGQALALLGIERLKRWAALTLFASIDDKPTELTITALVRARFCELAAGRLEGESHELFTLGLFSVIDALLDAPIDQALADIPLAPDLREALVAHRGQMGRLLECVRAVEEADFERAESLFSPVGELYPSAIEWADEAAEPLFAAA